MPERGGTPAWEANLAAGLEQERKQNLSDKENHQEKNVDNPPAEVSPPTLKEKEVRLTGEALFHQVEAIKDHRRAIQEHLGTLADNEETKQERQFLQEEIDRVNGELNPLLNQVAFEILDKLRRGEKMNEQERTYLVEDLVNSMDKSALAELILSREGFKNFEELLKELGVKSVRVEDYSVHLENDREAGWLKKFWGKSWVKRHTKKLGTTAVISTAAVGAIGLLGGPVTWAAMLGGLAGGTVARLGVERWRYSRLNKDGLGDKVAEDILRHIYDLQRYGQEALAADSEQARAEKIAKVLSGIDIGEKESLKNYRQLEKKAGKLNLAWGIVGSLAGAGLGAMALRGVEFSQLMDKAANEGVRLDLDGDSYAHLVKQNADGAWRFMLEQSDPQRLQEMLAGEHGAEFAQEHWRHYWEKYLAVVGPEGLPGYLPVPTAGELAAIEGPTNLFHVGSVGDKMGEGFRTAIEEMFSRQLAVKSAAVVAAMGGAHALVEGGFNLKENFRLAPERLRHHDQPLIHELEAEAIRLKKLSHSAEESALAPEVAEEKEESAKSPVDNLGFAIGDVVRVRRSSGKEEDGWKIYKFLVDEEGAYCARVVSPDEKYKKDIPLEKLAKLNTPERPNEADKEEKVPIKVTDSAEKLLPRYEAYLAGKLEPKEAAEFGKKEVDGESIKAFRQIYTRLLERYKQLPQHARGGLSFVGEIRGKENMVGFNRISFWDGDKRREFTIGYKRDKKGKIDQEIIIGTGNRRHKPNQMEALKFLRQVYQRLESRSGSPAEGRAAESNERKEKNKEPEEPDHSNKLQPDQDLLPTEQTSRGQRKQKRKAKGAIDEDSRRPPQKPKIDELVEQDELLDDSTEENTEPARKAESPKTERVGEPVLKENIANFLENLGLSRAEQLIGTELKINLNENAAKNLVAQIRREFGLPDEIESINLRLTSVEPNVNQDNEIYNYTLTVESDDYPENKTTLKLTSLGQLLGG